MGDVVKLPNAKLVRPPDPVVQDAMQRIHMLLSIYLQGGRRPSADTILRGVMEIMEEPELCRVAGIERPRAG